MIVVSEYFWLDTAGRIVWQLTPSAFPNERSPKRSEGDAEFLGSSVALAALRAPLALNSKRTRISGLDERVTSYSRYLPLPKVQTSINPYNFSVLASR
jgi:hypothetical protein